MRAGVRGITTGAVCIAVALATVCAGVGCSSSHAREDGGGWDGDAWDGGDARVDEPPDAARDAPIDGGALPSCDLPLREWRYGVLDVEGVIADAIAGGRDGSDTVIAVAGGGAIEVLRFAPDTPATVIETTTALEGTEGEVPIAFAADGFRSALLAGGQLRVHDVTGALLARVDREIVIETELEIRDTRIGMLERDAASGLARASVHDVGGGPPIVEVDLGDATPVALGHGRSLFAFVATREGTTRYSGLDELGAIEALDLGEEWSVGASDGPVLAGVTRAAIGSDVVRLRFPGGRLNHVSGLSGATAAIAIADGPHGTVVAERTRGGHVRVALPGVAEWRAHVPDVPIESALVADQGAARVGVFFVESGALRWAGARCAP